MAFPIRSEAFASLYERLPEGVRRRGPGFVLALVIEGLLLILLFTMAPQLLKPEEELPMAVFGIDAESGAPAPDAAKAAKSDGGAPNQRPAAPRPVPPPPVPPPPQPPQPKPEPPADLPEGIRKVTREEFRAADVGPGATAKKTGESPGGTGRSGTGRGDSAAIGKGPDGLPMYGVDWYRKPRDAELRPFYPSRPQQGWGQVVCRMVERYHVEDCRELGESPRGSGWARMVRQASWQFLVRPPVVDGKPQIGSWVRICMVFGESDGEPCSGAIRASGSADPSPDLIGPGS